MQADSTGGNVKWKFIRDTTMFLAGLAGFAHELIIQEQERSTLIFACLALMGVPFFLRRDEKEEDE